MAKESRRGPARAPGGDTPRARTASRPHSRSRSRPAADVGPVRRHDGAESSHERRGSRITGRAVALIVTVALLTLSYATSLRVWIDQKNEIASTHADIRAANARIAELEDKIERWNDPEYVKAQARERLGWVLPGETGYRVVGPDGKPFGGGAQINFGTVEDPQSWYAKVSGSVQAADTPEPVKHDATNDKPIGPEATPTATAKPTKRR